MNSAKIGFLFGCAAFKMAFVYWWEAWKCLVGGFLSWLIRDDYGDIDGDI